MFIFRIMKETKKEIEKKRTTKKKKSGRYECSYILRDALYFKSSFIYIYTLHLEEAFIF